jgi:WD40 repeat protein
VADEPSGAGPKSVQAPGLLAARGVGRELHWIGTEAGGLYHRAIDLAAGGQVLEPSTPVLLTLDADMTEGLKGADLDRVFRLRPVADLSPDGRRVAMSGFAKVVHLWDAGTGAALGDIPFRGFPCAVLFAPDGSRLAVDGGTTVYVHDTASRELVAKWKVNPCDIPGLAWSPDGRLLARADNSTTARVYDAATGRQVSAFGTGVRLEDRGGHGAGVRPGRADVRGRHLGRPGPRVGPGRRLSRPGKVFGCASMSARRARSTRSRSSLATGPGWPR